MPIFFPTSVQLLRLQWLVGEGKKKKASVPVSKSQFPSVVSDEYETGELKSLVLRCRSCIQNASSSSPGVKERCEVGATITFPGQDDQSAG